MKYHETLNIKNDQVPRNKWKKKLNKAYLKNIIKKILVNGNFAEAALSASQINL